MGEEDDDLCLREDLVELAGSLQQSSFNVKKFKRKHAAKPIRLSDQRIYSRLQSEPSEKRQIPHVQSRTFAEGLNSALRYNQTFIPPQKKAKFFAKSQPKSPFLKSSRKQQINELQKYQKLWSNGRMKEKCIQEWLNAVLVQFCHDEFFDKTIANCALKKMGIDENSLVAKGLPAQNVVRLYRSLFVFGMGFNNLLGELAGNRMEVLKTVWRVYSIILEYCSRGGMVTVIGEIEREASAKITELAGEIERKQDIIERNEELNQAKNDEIFREVKKLRQDNCNLNNEKTVLVEEYNATQQAFSEQVGLRLKFQTKINEIYGLHRDLGIKHQKLFQDLSTKIEQLRVLADKYFQSTICLQEFRESQYKMKEELILLKMSYSKQKQFTEGLVKERVELLGKVSRLEYSLEESRSQIIELRNKQKRWSSEREGIETMMQLRQKSAKETHSEYQITLEENNRLYILLSDQRKVMEQYEKEKRTFNSKIINIVSENSFHKRKFEQAQRRYDSIVEQMKVLQQKRESLQLQLQIKSKNQESYQVFFSKNQQNIQEMQRINYANEEELIFLRKYYKNMEKILRDKNETFQSLSVRYEQTKQSLQRVTVELQQIKSKFLLLEQQCKNQQQQYVFRNAKLRLLSEELSNKQQQLQKERERFQLEEQRLKNQLDAVAVSWKNEKFQRSTLQSSYLQSLKIMQKKNAAERQLNVKISMQQGMIQQERKRCKHLEKSMLDLIAQFALLQQHLQQTLNSQRSIIAAKEQFVHPLIVEDLKSYLLRQVQKSTALNVEHSKVKLDLQKQKFMRVQDVERLHQQYRWDINILSKQAEKKAQSLEAELAYEQQETKSLKKRILEIEESNEQLKNKLKSRPSVDRQAVYKALLEQKKQQVESLLADMQKLQDELQKARIESSYERGAQHSPNDQGFTENKSTLDQLNALKKELQHEFGLKLRELQRQMRNELIKKEQALQEQFSGKLKVLSVEQILRLKDLRPQDALREISSSIKAGRGERSRDPTGRQQREQRISNSQPKASRKITRLLKQAYQYYNN